jgi:hypothetical protein
MAVVFHIANNVKGAAVRIRMSNEFPERWKFVVIVNKKGQMSLEATVPREAKP